MQTEKSFLKQPKVFLSTKRSAKGKAPGKAGTRFWKNVGLGFKTPREAIEGMDVCMAMLWSFHVPECKSYFGLLLIHHAARFRSSGVNLNCDLLLTLPFGFLKDPNTVRGVSVSDSRTI